MSIKSILAVTDLSPRENSAASRACQLAQIHRAAVKLLYVPANGEPLHSAAASRLSAAARRLEDAYGLPVRTAPVKTAKLEDLVTAAGDVDLVLLPHRQERSTAAFFRGQPVLRLLRSCNRPVLIARRSPETTYRRILVAVDLAAQSLPLLQLASELQPEANLDVFHAISTLDEAKLRSAEATEQAVRHYRKKRLQDTQERIASLIESLRHGPHNIQEVISYGDPGRQAVMQQKRSGADLVLVGKRRASVWHDFFCGSVAHRILSWGSSDVLVVPETFLQATAHVAARRMRRRGPQRALGIGAPGRKTS